MRMDARDRIRWCPSRRRSFRACVLLALAGAWLACGRSELGETDSAGERVVPCSGVLTFSGMPLPRPGQATAVGQPLVVDLDGDGIDELVVPGHEALSFYGAHGIGALTAPEQTYSTETPFSLAAGDLDGDGRIDLVVVHETPDLAQVVDVLINDGNGYSLGSQYPRRRLGPHYVGDASRPRRRRQARCLLLRPALSPRSRRRDVRPSADRAVHACRQRADREGP